MDNRFSLNENERHARRAPRPVLAIAMCCSGVVWLMGVATVYVSLEPTSTSLENWIQQRNQFLNELGVDHRGKSHSDQTVVLRNKMMENPEVAERAEASINRRAEIYAQLENVEKNVFLKTACIVSTFRMPRDAALAMAERSFLTTFSPGVVQIGALLGIGGFLLVSLVRKSADKPA